MFFDVTEPLLPGTKFLRKIGVGNGKIKILHQYTGRKKLARRTYETRNC
jgi:hypothetical protein